MNFSPSRTNSSLVLSLVVTSLLASCSDDNGGPSALITEGLQWPESAIFDEATQTFFVSNLGHNILETDFLNPPRNGDGYVSRHHSDGTLLNRDFISGLDGPKGIAIARGILYVTDLDAIVAVELSTGEPIARYETEGVFGLNDIVADGDSLFFTSTALNSVYRLSPDSVPAISLVAHDPNFEFPNGIAVDSNSIFFASTGLFPSENSPGTLGEIFSIEKATGTVSTVGTISGKWDGVVSLCDGSLAVNEFSTGDITRIDPSTGRTELIQENFVESTLPLAGLADVNGNGCDLLIPSMFTHTIYTLTPETN